MVSRVAHLGFYGNMFSWNSVHEIRLKLFQYSNQNKPNKTSTEGRLCWQKLDQKPRKYIASDDHNYLTLSLEDIMLQTLRFWSIVYILKPLIPW